MNLNKIFSVTNCGRKFIAMKSRNLTENISWEVKNSRKNQDIWQKISGKAWIAFRCKYQNHDKWTWQNIFYEQFWQKIYCNETEKCYRNISWEVKNFRKNQDTYLKEIFGKAEIVFGCEYQNRDKYAWIWQNIFCETSRARIFSAN